MTPEKDETSPAVASRDALHRAQSALGVCAQVLGEVVEAEARHRAELLAAGCRLGPLHGVPFVVKDIIDVAGCPTKAGSDLRADAPPAVKDAPVVARLRAAGAIPVAKTNTVEFALGGWGTNASQGTPVNPWKPDDPHTPGGSSSGTGVAVGGGFVPAGLGTDTGGSVRIPAAFCGCVGLKTSTGLVGRSGVVPLSETYDTIGPLTDTVKRTAEMLNVMMGEDDANPSTRGIFGQDALAELDRGMAGLRIGVVSDDALLHAKPNVVSAFGEAMDIMDGAGAQLVPFALPRDFETYQRLGAVIMSSDAYAVNADMVDDLRSSINDTTRARMLAGRDVTAKDRISAEKLRVADIAAFLNAMDRLDAIVLPASPTTAIPLSEVDEDDYTVSLYTRAGNYLDLAAIVVPIGLTSEGLPTSLQIMVRRFDDALALRIGRAFEQARGEFPQPPVLYF